MNCVSAVRDLRGMAESELDARGYLIFPAILRDVECDSLSAELTRRFEAQQQTSRNKIGGVRNLLRLSARVSQLATSARFLSLIEQTTGQLAFPVRAIFFDKTAKSNWRVPWHQDLTIAVARRIETAGFGPWSVKEGVVHVQPPLEILESMVAIRLHLDDCGAANGALRVIPGSHRGGGFDAGKIETLTDSAEPLTCEGARGGVLVMRPLLLHASSLAMPPSHRRVLHIEYATHELPNGLQWHDR